MAVKKKILNYSIEP